MDYQQKLINHQQRLILINESIRDFLFILCNPNSPSSKCNFEKQK